MKNKVSEEKWTVIRLVIGLVESAVMICVSGVMFFVLGIEFLANLTGMARRHFSIAFFENIRLMNNLVSTNERVKLYSTVGFIILLLFFLFSLLLLAYNILEYYKVRNGEKPQYKVVK